jgi:putative hydrolase of the HAD superfamily
LRPGASPLVARLRGEVDVAVWSNTDPIHFSWYAPRLGCLSRARSLWLSFLVGAAKPAREFYEGALRSLGRGAAEVLFVDDLPENVVAARSLGIDAVQAASIAEVEALLEARGLLRA